MTEKITSIKKNKSSAKDWTVRETLEDTLRQMEEEDFIFDQAIICFLKTDGDTYISGLRLSNMTGSEAVTLMEVVKGQIVDNLRGYE